MSHRAPSAPPLPATLTLYHALRRIAGPVVAYRLSFGRRR